MTIFELVDAKILASYWNELTQNKAPFLGETLFPNKKKIGLDLSWIKGSKGLPVELKLSSFDAKTVMRDRIGFDQIKTKMPFFKEGAYIDEELRQELLKVVESGNQAYIDAILNQVFDTEKGLVESASISRERMRMQLLTTGAVTLANNGQEYSYDYGMPVENKKTVAKLWSDLENADPVADLTEMADAIEDKTGVRPTRAIMSRKTFGYIKNNPKIQKSLYVTAETIGVVTDTMVLNAIRELTGITIAIYSKKYKDAQGNEKSYIPDNVVSMIPEGNLGSTWFGTTPEEADLLSGAQASVELVDTGVAITTTKETDPVNVMTKVTQVSLPSFEQVDKVAILTVA